MNNCNLYFFWPILRVIFIVITTCAGIFQAYLFFNYETKFSSFTRVTEDELYCVGPKIVTFENIGNGQIQLTLEGVLNNLFIEDPLSSEFIVKQQKGIWTISGSLKQGFNELALNIDGQKKMLRTVFTPNSVYKDKNNSLKIFSGIIGLYPSSLCMGQLIPIERWIPKVSLNTLSNSQASSAKLKDIFIEAILFLEPSRGIPDNKIEVESIENVVRQIQDRSSYAWCSQISLYIIAKLGGHIPIRLVGNAGFWNFDRSVRTGGHAFIEYYDNEFQRWALADPTNYIFAIRNARGDPLNAIEFSRILSLPNSLELQTLQFDVVNIEKSKLEIKKFIELPLNLQRDFQFYFRPGNPVVYHTANSSIYQPNFLRKVGDWMAYDRRYILEVNNISTVDIAKVRIISFWALVLGIATLISGELLTRSRRSM